jgi:hypothetical protein
VKQAERILKEQKGRWTKHLAPVFGDKKAVLVIAQDLQEYQATRIEDGARYATINHELQLLRRALRLGFERRPKLVSDVPAFPKRLAESPRTGFIEDATFAKLLAAVKEPGLRGLVLTAFRWGFRKSELQDLLCLQLADGWLRLFAGATKNGKSRREAAGVPELIFTTCDGQRCDACEGRACRLRRRCSLPGTSHAWCSTTTTQQTRRTWQVRQKYCEQIVHKAGRAVAPSV